jgi:hypothetical protein
MDKHHLDLNDMDKELIVRDHLWITIKMPNNMLLRLIMMGISINPFIAFFKF